VSPLPSPLPNHRSASIDPDCGWFKCEVPTVPFGTGLDGHLTLFRHVCDRPIIASVEDFLNVAATETVPLFEHLDFDFLLEYDVFAPASRGRTRVHEPPDLFCGFLHCYYENVYGTRSVTRELQYGLVLYYCGLDKPPSRDTVDRFLTDLEHVIDEIFDWLVKQAA